MASEGVFRIKYFIEAKKGYEKHLTHYISLLKIVNKNHQLTFKRESIPGNYPFNLK
jgi:hypothetical protein